MIKHLPKLLLLSSFAIATTQNASAQRDCGTGGDQGGSIGGGIVKAAQVLFEWTITGLLAIDPNEIRGQKGYAEKQWVSVKDRLGYTISFENDGEFATASAQNVLIYLKLNSQISTNSFRLKSFGFGSFNYYVPENTVNYTTRLDLRDSLGIYVDVTSGIDPVNNDIFWFFKSIDPATGQTPTDARGFLAISDTALNATNDTLGKGKGYVRFSIEPSSNLNTGDTLPAQASIVFDVNEALLTNTWVNTVDAVSPTSRIISGSVSNQNIFTLNWSGQDDMGGSGVRDYALYYSEDNAPSKLYKEGITELSTTFAGTPGSDYCFYVLATDNTGNKEARKTTCEFRVGAALPVTWLYFKGQPQRKDVLLTWATVSEKNSKEFSVERSLDGRTFASIGTVQAIGSSSQTNNYTYTDIDAMQLPVKILYYRLKQIDLDDKYLYSTVVAIPTTKAGNEPAVFAYPNPFTQNITLQIVNITASDKDDVAELYSLEGKILYRKRITNAGNATVLLNDLPNLTPGIYLLKTVLNKKEFTIKMVRQ